MANTIPGYTNRIGAENPHLENGIQGTNGLPLPPPRVGQNYSQPYSSSYGYGTPNYSYGTPNYSYGTSSYSPYRPMYNSYSSNYSPYSAYSRPYRSSTYNTLQQGPSFFEQAHENTREAFAGIESIVSAFGSINMMIESTYHALQSSFNAVLSVIDNFSRLKNHFSQILSAFTIIKTLQWMLKKILYLVGFRKHDPTSEAVWKSATEIFNKDSKVTKSSKSSWPMIAFLMAVYAGPFIMWKFLSSILQNNSTIDSDWSDPKGSHYFANAVYNYTAQNPDELSINAGDYLILAPKEIQTDKSWPLAYNGKTTGIVPVNYIKIGYKNINSISESTQDKQTTKC